MIRTDQRRPYFGLKGVGRERFLRGSNNGAETCKIGPINRLYQVKGMGKTEEQSN